jgi:hypothetical protein
MLGFNDLRFFELIQTDLHQFRCGLCLGLLNKPLETKCCRKTYCKKCITSQINKNGFCPNDRQLLSADDLINPSLIVMNMLSNLKRMSGYQEVFSCGSLERRLEECNYELQELKVEKDCEHNNCLDIRLLKSKLVLAENEIKDLMTTTKQIMVQNVKSIRNLNEKIAILRKVLIKSDVILTKKQSNYKIKLKIIELKLNY